MRIFVAILIVLFIWFIRRQQIENIFVCIGYIVMDRNSLLFSTFYQSFDNRKVGRCQYVFGTSCGNTHTKKTLNAFMFYVRTDLTIDSFHSCIQSEYKMGMERVNRVWNVDGRKRKMKNSHANAPYWRILSWPVITRAKQWNTFTINLSVVQNKYLSLSKWRKKNSGSKYYTAAKTNKIVVDGIVVVTIFFIRYLPTMHENFTVNKKEFTIIRFFWMVLFTKSM